jgi:DNA-directed RNA polymerase specialized sigma24 family protein
VKLAATTTAPRSLASFVITGFRNHVTDVRRESAARVRFERECGSGERADGVAAAGCSEFMLRAAEGVCAPDVRSSGEELLRIVLQRCSAEERQLLVWSSHRVPLRECAVWLGISYDSAKQRLSRLRARLIRESVASLSRLGDEDRAALVRLLRSAGVAIDTDNTRGSAA